MKIFFKISCLELNVYTNCPHTNFLSLSHTHTHSHTQWSVIAEAERAPLSRPLCALASHSVRTLYCSLAREGHPALSPEEIKSGLIYLMSGFCLVSPWPQTLPSLPCQSPLFKFKRSVFGNNSTPAAFNLIICHCSFSGNNCFPLHLRYSQDNMFPSFLCHEDNGISLLVPQPDN